MKNRPFVLMVMALSIACASVTPTASPTFTLSPTYTPSPRPTQSPAPTLSPTPTATSRPGYSTAFGIDYGQPDKYLAQGEQTHLSNPTVVNSLRHQAQSVAHLGEIYFWIKREFTPWSAGGKTIGALTTDQLFAERRLGGCHDWGQVYASVARELGYPTVMVDTASIAWAKQFQSGQKGPYVGHVFVEVFVAGKWVLIDSTNNWYVENGYDPTNPIIPLKGDIAGSSAETLGFYVMRKGADTWGYNIRSASELNRLMEESARSLKIDTLQYPSYNFQRFR
jgi:transglutaminase-like putative cysteine protease